MSAELNITCSLPYIIGCNAGEVNACLRGELLPARDGLRASAETLQWFQRALALGREKGGPAWELRADIRLVRLRQPAPWTAHQGWLDSSPLIYLNTPAKFTLALGVQYFRGFADFATQWHLLMAAGTVLTIPPLLVFIFFQRYFIAGLALTGLRG